MDKYFKGVITGIDGQEITIKFESLGAIEHFRQLADIDLSVSVKKYRENRSLRQNAFFWACVGDIAQATQNPDKCQIYLELLKRYGKFTHILIKPQAVEMMKKLYREVEVLGDVKTDKGETATQLRVYVGSHLYDTAEMAKLITGTVDEMKTLGLKLPPSEEMKALFGL